MAYSRQAFFSAQYSDGELLDGLLKSGLNIITGSNEAGKTQLFGAIVFCFFGPKVLRIGKDVQSKSCVRLTYEKDKYKQIIEYTYSKGCLLKTFIDKRNALIHDTGIENYENFFYKYKPSFISDSRFIKELPNKQDLDFVTKVIVDDPSMIETWNRIKRKYESQISGVENKKIFISSMGTELLLKLIKRLLIQIKIESPIIIDEVFIYFDENTNSFIMRLLEILSHKRQIILFSFPLNVETKDIVYSLSDRTHALSSIAYDYDYTQKILLPPEDKEIQKNEDNPVIVRYILDNQLQDEEYRKVEFKEVKGQNPIDSIKNVVDKYIVAFLNDYSNYKGRIIWGVTDKERKVVGVKLDYRQRDTLRRVITEKLSKINPSIPPSSYVVLLQPVYDTNKNEIKDLYIVEVLVEATRSQFLYATAGNKVFIKTDGGKKRLTPMEIQQEVLRRKRQKFNGA